MPSFRPLIAFGATLCAVLALPPSGYADEAAASQTAGAVVVRDRETGALRAPTADEASRYLDAADGAERVGDEARLTRRADGSESLRLDGRYTTWLTVRRGAAGDWEETCRQAHDHATAHAASAQADDGRAVR